MFVFTLTVGFYMDIKVKSSHIIADEVIMIKLLLRKYYNSTLKSFFKPILESDMSRLVNSCLHNNISFYHQQLKKMLTH